MPQKTVVYCTVFWQMNIAYIYVNDPQYVYVPILYVVVSFVVHCSILQYI